MTKRDTTPMKRRSFLRSAAALGAVPVLWSTSVAAEDGPDLTAEEVERAATLVERLERAPATERAFENLPTDDQTLVAEFLKPASVEVAAVEKPSTNDSCKAVEVWVEGRNLVDGRLWSYHQEVTWCYDGSAVTYTNRRRWGETHTIGWAFDGHVGSDEQGGTGWSFYEAWTQGEFKLCLGGDIGCVQHTYPWIETTVYGSGGYSYDTS